ELLVVLVVAWLALARSFGSIECGRVHGPRARNPRSIRYVARRARRDGAPRRGRPYRPRSSSLARSRTLRLFKESPRPARFKKNVNIDIADRNESVLRRRLRSAERLSDMATARGLDFWNTPGSRSSA